MGIDSSIAMGVRTPQLESPMNALAQMMQIQQAQQSNQLNGMKMDEYTRGVGDNNKLNALYSGALRPDGTLDRTKVLSGAAAGGLGSKIPGLQKSWSEQDEATGKVDAQKFKLASERHTLYQKEMGALSQNPNLTREMALQVGQSLVQQGILPAEMFEKSAANLPDDPAQLRKMLIQGLQSQLTPEQIFTVFAPKAEKIDNNGSISFRDTNPNSPTYGQATGGAAVQKVQSPDSIASTAQSNTNSLRTDERARDLNVIKTEENNIKRSQKNDDLNLMKGSQIASFDTMLGTLDRLSKHPGLSRSVGITGALPTMPGSNSANFQAELNTFQSQAFLPMVAQLKGMGALSDAEGKKLTAAVGALDPKMGEEAFRDSVARITADMQAARDRMVGGTAQPTPKPAGKTASMADIQATAKASGKTVEEVKAAMKAKGYVVN